MDDYPIKAFIAVHPIGGPIFSTLSSDRERAEREAVYGRYGVITASVSNKSFEDLEREGWCVDTVTIVKDGTNN